MSESGEVKREEQEPEVSREHKNQTPEVSRRQFLAGLLGFGAAYFLKGDSGETEKNRLGTFVLDIFDTENFKDRAVQDRLQGKNISEAEILKKIGINDPTTLEGLKEGIPTNEDETFVFMLNVLKCYWSDHGKNVIQVKEKAKKLFDFPPSKVSSDSIVNAVNVSRLEYDNAGNPTLWLKINKEVVERKLAFVNDPVVNASFELGEVGFKYELYDFTYEIPSHTAGSEITVNGVTSYTDNQGNPVSREKYEELTAMKKKEIRRLLAAKEREFWPQDAYVIYDDENRAYDNLKLMAELGIKFSDKVIIASAGNPSKRSTAYFPRVDKLKKRLIEENNWPNNLFLVGVYGYDSGKEGVATYGADFYVDQRQMEEQLAVSGVASFATPIVTEIVTLLYSQGIRQPEEIKKILITLCDKKIDNETSLWVLNFDKIKSKLGQY